MKLKYIIVIIQLFFFLSGKAQKELQIQYRVQNNEIDSRVKKKAVLRANSTTVLFTEQCFYDVPGPRGSNRVVETINQSYKDLQSNCIWSLEDQKRVVKEEMNLFKWKFISETESILNYNCRKAVCEFRGRKYEAWFTTELPFRAAPWKIHALPGVVLKLLIDKDYYILEVDSLSVFESTEEIKMPFKGKIIEWNEYVEAYKKDIKEYERYYKSMEVQTGETWYCADPKIEIIVEHNKGTFDVQAEINGLNKEY